MEKILVIDDDKELCEFLREYLKPEGFEVDTVHNVETGIEIISNNSYCIVLLGIMLPGGQNGFDFLRLLRTKYILPVIILTARDDDVDRIIGLEMGADDCIPKPFNPRELIARIRAVLRRSRNIQQDLKTNMVTKKYISGDLELDTGLHIVLKANKPLKLTSVEFSLLELLMRNSGRVVSRDAIAKEVLDRPLLPFDRSIDVHVCNLRRKLGIESNEFVSIKAIRSSGYIFIPSPSGCKKSLEPEDRNSQEENSHDKE